MESDYRTEVFVMAAGMTKRKAFKGEKADPYSASQSQIVLYYEMPFKSDIIKPGDKIKIKNVRGQFVFKCLVHNLSLNKQWVDCMTDTGFCRSFYVDRVSAVVRPKRSRRKRVN